jgi:hypothetical protein
MNAPYARANALLHVLQMKGFSRVSRSSINIEGQPLERRYATHGTGNVLLSDQPGCSSVCKYCRRKDSSRPRILCLYMETVFHLVPAPLAHRLSSSGSSSNYQGASPEPYSDVLDIKCSLLEVRMGFSWLVM